MIMTNSDGANSKSSQEQSGRGGFTFLDNSKYHEYVLFFRAKPYKYFIIHGRIISKSKKNVKTTLFL